MPGAQQPASGDVGSIPIHQLSAREYDNTARDLLGTRLKPGVGFQSFEAAGFDTLAAAGVMNSRKVTGYFDAASSLAEELFADPTRRAGVVTCQPAAGNDTSCAESIIKAFGLRAFRRPLEPTEVADLVSRCQAALGLGLAHEGALQHVVRIMLTSPQFIYRIEFDPDPASVHLLTGHEVASRLSYLVWSSMPDALLLAAADSGELKSSDALAATVDRMLADPRSRELVDNFAAQWLGARRLDDHVVDPAVYPAWTPALGVAMQQEMAAYFDDFLHGDQTYDKFLTSNVNFVDSGLAALYGLPDPGSAALTRVQNTSGQRTGFMGLAGFLTHTSRMDRTAPSIRGKWIVNSLKCMELELPPNLTPPPLGEPAAGQTVRQVLEAHRANPSCAGCHTMMDRIGFSLEHLDAAGRYRETENSYPIDDSGSVTGTSKGDLKVTGPAELATTISQLPEVTDCVSSYLGGYALGLNHDSAACLVSNAASELRSGGSLLDFYVHIARSEHFRSRQ